MGLSWTTLGAWGQAPVTTTSAFVAASPVPQQKLLSGAVSIIPQQVSPVLINWESAV